MPFLPAEDNSFDQGQVDVELCESQEDVVHAVIDVLGIDQVKDEVIVVYADDGIVKWRENNGEPYRGYPLIRSNEYVVGGRMVEEYANALEDDSKLFGKLGNSEYREVEPMNIPLYRYPSGEMAKKIGIRYEEERYLIGIYDDFSNLNANDQQVSVKIYCAEPTSDLVNQYDYYVQQPRKYPDESTVTFEDLGDNLARINVLYPGADGIYQSHEFWDIHTMPWKKIAETGEFPDCSIFEKYKVGVGSSCYMPEKQEFSLVNY